MGFEKLDRTVLTADGSHTWFSERFGQSYHSRHGALAESRRVFLELGFESKLPGIGTPTGFNPLRSNSGKLTILEMGFGTGLNALLTWLEAENRQIPVHYTTLEAYPILPEEAAALNYDTVLGTDRLATLHGAAWSEDVVLSDYFTVRKERVTLETFMAGGSGNHERFDLIYFDAFGPRTQPELWTPEVFSALAGMMRPDGVLTTYSAKGSVRRALEQAGFRVEKHPGPPGKSEVVRAIKS